jgi:hypothetical protein
VVSLDLAAPAPVVDQVAVRREQSYFSALDAMVLRSAEEIENEYRNGSPARDPFLDSSPL